MNSNRFARILVLVGLASFIFGCQQQPPSEAPDTRAADEAAIRAVGDAWSEAMAAKDVDKIMSFFAADAKSWWNGKEEVDKDVIRQDVTAGFADPNYALTWEITKLRVARAGDLAYEMGTYEETTSDARKEPQTKTGKYVTIWEKQADGAWRATVDIGVLDQ